MNNPPIPEIIEGVWESVNLNPTIIIIRQFGGVYRLMIFHIDTSTQQARPAVYDIEEDEKGLYAGASINLHRIDYDPVADTLTISDLGEYIRNW